MGWAGALSGENGRDRRGGQADVYPIGPERPTTISADSPLPDSFYRDLRRRRAFPRLCYLIINQCPSGFQDTLCWIMVIFFLSS